MLLAYIFLGGFAAVTLARSPLFGCLVFAIAVYVAVMLPVWTVEGKFPLTEQRDPNVAKVERSQAVERHNQAVAEEGAKARIARAKHSTTPGSSIATAVPIKLEESVTEAGLKSYDETTALGDTGTTTYTYGLNNCTETGEYRSITLKSGDKVSIGYEDVEGEPMGLDVWPVGTTDENIKYAQPIYSAPAGGLNVMGPTFTADQPGTYPIVFDDNCGANGPGQEYTAGISVETEEDRLANR